MSPPPNVEDTPCPACGKFTLRIELRLYPGGFAVACLDCAERNECIKEDA